MAQAPAPAADDRRKRARAVDVSLLHVWHYARLIMHNDPFKERAPQDEEERFRALFGCGPYIVLLLWKLLGEHDLLPPEDGSQDSLMSQLLWTLMYCKTYAKWKTMKILSAGKDPKTMRKAIRRFLEAIEQLESVVVRVVVVCPPWMLVAEEI